MTTYPGLAQYALYSCTHTATVGVKGLKHDKRRYQINYKIIQHNATAKTIYTTTTQSALGDRNRSVVCHQHRDQEVADAVG